MSRRLVTIAVAACFVLPTAACGGETGIGETASASLVPQVQAIRAAAARGEGETARAGLAQLRQAVARLQAAEQLSRPEAAKILSAAADVEHQLSLVPTTTTPPGEADDDDGASTSGGTDEAELRRRADEARRRAEDAAKEAEEKVKDPKGGSEDD